MGTQDFWREGTSISVTEELRWKEKDNRALSCFFLKKGKVSRVNVILCEYNVHANYRSSLEYLLFCFLLFYIVCSKNILTNIREHLFQFV
jgi:uncharacterized membrane protein